MRVPRNAVIERVQVLEGRIAVDGFSGTLTADIRRGPIDGKNVSGTLRLEAGIGSVTLTDARLSAERPAAAALLQRRRATDAGRAAGRRAHHGAGAERHIQSDIPLTTRDTWGPRWGEATLGRASR